MADEKITSTREVVIAEILGDVSNLGDQVKTIHDELVASNKKIKEQYENAKQALFLSRTETLESIQQDAAKLLRDGVFNEVNGIKREVNNLIIELTRSANELRTRQRWYFVIYIFASSFGVALATFLIEKIMLDR